jgi:hypothetical protein
MIAAVVLIIPVKNRWFDKLILRFYWCLASSWTFLCVGISWLHQQVLGAAGSADILYFNNT